MGKVVENVWKATGVGIFTKQILGLGGKTPKTDVSAATAIVDDAKKNAKKARAQALSTMGGVSGEELDGTQVSKVGDTLFGN